MFRLRKDIETKNGFTFGFKSSITKLSEKLKEYMDSLKQKLRRQSLSPIEIAAYQ